MNFAITTQAIVHRVLSLSVSLSHPHTNVWTCFETCRHTCTHTPQLSCMLDTHTDTQTQTCVCMSFSSSIVCLVVGASHLALGFLRVLQICTTVFSVCGCIWQLHTSRNFSSLPIFKHLTSSVAILYLVTSFFWQYFNCCISVFGCILITAFLSLAVF